MNKRIVLSAVSIILSFVLIFSSCYVCFYHIGIKRKTNVTISESDNINEFISADIDSSLTTEFGFVVKPTAQNSYSTYGDVEVIVENGVLAGYMTEGASFSFNVSVSTSIIDTIQYNGKNIASKYYSGGDMNPDILLLGLQRSLQGIYLPCRRTPS